MPVYSGPKPKNKKGHKKYDVSVDIFTDGGSLAASNTPVFFINYSPSTPCFYGEDVNNLEVIDLNNEEIVISVKYDAELECYVTYVPPTEG